MTVDSTHSTHSTIPSYRLPDTVTMRQELFPEGWHCPKVWGGGSLRELRECIRGPLIPRGRCLFSPFICCISHPCRLPVLNTNWPSYVQIMVPHNISFTNACSAQAISFPQLFGLEVLDAQASPVTNLSLSATPVQVWTKSEFSGLDFSRTG
jgi:hypothetical protein